MAGKKEVLAKVKVLLTQTFKKPEDAFTFFDKNGDRKLSKKELKDLLKAAKVNGFISGIAAGQMIKGLDKSSDKMLNWSELEKAVESLIQST